MNLDALVRSASLIFLFHQRFLLLESVYFLIYFILFYSKSGSTLPPPPPPNPPAPPPARALVAQVFLGACPQVFHSWSLRSNPFLPKALFTQFRRPAQKGKVYKSCPHENNTCPARYNWSIAWTCILRSCMNYATFDQVFLIYINIYIFSIY